MNVALNVLNNKELFLTKNKFIFNKDDEYQNTNLRPTYKSYLVEKENFAISRNECAISYAYDDLGRLLAVNYFKEQTHNYEYDYRGYLISDNNLSIEYDNNGNILKKGDVSYTYDPVIKDRLIKVGNETIEYDTNNPLIPTKYLDKRLKFEGKRLKEVTKNNKTSYLYYDEEGYLIKKIDGNNKVTNFVYENGNLLYLKKDNDEFDFLYDENNLLYGFILNKCDTYYYLRDIFNNILGILDSQGEIIVSYEYDAFGKIINTEDLSSIQLGTINPFKYKGYYYDNETQFYWLSSRYYSPELGRLLQVSDVSELNLYAYANNNPISFSYNNSSSIASASVGSGLISSIGVGSSLSGNVNSGSTSKGLLNLGWLVNGLDIGSTIHGLYVSISGLVIHTTYFAKNLSPFADDMTMLGASIKDGVLTFNQFSWRLGKSDVFGIALGVTLDAYDSIQRGVSPGGVVFGATLTAAKGVGLIYLNKGILYVATSLGSAICPGVGTVVGFVVGGVVCIVVDIFASNLLDDLIDKIAK